MLWSYWDIARTSFLGNLALPVSAQTFYFAALAFGVGTPLMLFLYSLLGGVGANLLHIAFGAGIERFNYVRTQPSFLKFRSQMQRWGVWMLLIPGLRFQGLMVILFAVIGVHPRRVLLCSTLGLGIGYAFMTFVSHDSRILSYFLTPY